MKILANSKTAYKVWNVKFINAMTQAKYGTRNIFKAMMKHSGHQSPGRVQAGIDWGIEDVDEDKFDNELYVILVEKTDG